MKRPAAFTIEIGPLHGTALTEAWIKLGTLDVGHALGRSAEEAAAKALENADDRRWAELPRSKEIAA